MSTILCPKCGKTLADAKKGFITGCEHFPLRIGLEEGRSYIHFGDINEDDGFGVEGSDNLSYLFSLIMIMAASGAVTRVSQ